MHQINIWISLKRVFGSSSFGNIKSKSQFVPSAISVSQQSSINKDISDLLLLSSLSVWSYRLSKIIGLVSVMLMLIHVVAINRTDGLLTLDPTTVDHRSKMIL